MSKRPARRQSSRERRAQEKRTRLRSKLIRRMSWVAGVAVVLAGVVAGGIFYAGSQSSDQALSSSLASTGREVGSDTGNYVPEFDLQLVDGSTVTSAELVSTDKPAFYFFFATW